MNQRSSAEQRNSQKAKRQKQPTTLNCVTTKSENVVELDGVPLNVTPQLIEAIKATKAYISNHAVETIVMPPANDAHDLLLRQRHSQTNLMDSILNRVEEAKEIEQRRKQKELLENMNQARDIWLAAVGRERNTALPCFLYIWELQTNHKKPIVRRTSLHLCGHLLLAHEGECQTRWIHNSLLEWISLVVEDPSIPDKYRSQVPLWQKEAYQWLGRLLEGRKHPKLQVAMRLLRQRCPAILSDSNNTGETKRMPDWRRIRDVALKHGDREIQVVEKLLRKAQRCLEMIMPRMTADNGSSEEKETANFALTAKGQAEKSIQNDSEDDESDDDDIDWEDGDEEGQHAAAVEQTLALMQTTGVLQGGDVEINLGISKNDDGDIEEATTEALAETKRKLQKTIQSLSARHLPCLTTWLSALVESDALVLRGLSSLIAMTADESVKRQQLQTRLIGLKSEVASVLNAASTLDIKANVESPSNGERPTRVAVATVPRRHDNLTKAISKKRSSGSRSHHIQIKYRKS